MKISATFRKSYPKLSSWIEINMPKVKSKNKVWTAFVKYSELTSPKAKQALNKGQFPEIHFSIMPSAYGKFKGSTYPNRVYIAKSICDKFEKSDSKNAKMHMLVEATLLHEMVHWGDYKDGVDQAGEEGLKFEKAAYGKVINGYW